MESYAKQLDKVYNKFETFKNKKMFQMKFWYTCHEEDKKGSFSAAFLCKIEGIDIILLK